VATEGTNQREFWLSRTGVILAMAGNAIGLGNFLRFPVQAAENGGGAFMIPYIIAFFIIGIPLMWVEWGMGRYGGARGHGTSPAIFNLLWNSPIAKFIGVFGLWIPLVVAVYYIYIESWALGYSVYFLVGRSPGLPNSPPLNVAGYLEPFSNFLNTYIGERAGNFFYPSLMAYLAFIVTYVLNISILIRGISRGIEILAKIALPSLFILALILLVRVLTLKTLYGSAIQGLNFLWNPDLGSLRSPEVWIAAAGQIFFTLSLGFGAIITYASYVRQDQDITLSGLTAATLNETAEVVLGGSIAIPAAVAFFGVAGAVSIAKSGAFNLGFISLPAIFASIPAGNFLGFLWFLLLFFAGLTSSVAIIQPIVSFFQDEYGLSRRTAVLFTGAIILISVPLIIFIHKTLDEMDFWAGTIGVVLFGFLELIIFMWIFGGRRAWEEINREGIIRIPKVFYYILRYVTPCYLMILLGSWGYKALPNLIEKGDWTIWVARVYLIGLFIFLAVLVFFAERRKKKEGYEH
jgi:NSS family neurotransmitter:Na+ symporter